MLLVVWYSGYTMLTVFLTYTSLLRRILVYIYLYVMISKMFALHLGLEGRSTLLSAFGISLE